jgi:hypothetical protein
MPSPTTVSATQRSLGSLSRREAASLCRADPINSGSGRKGGKPWRSLTACQPAPAATWPDGIGLAHKREPF